MVVRVGRGVSLGHHVEFDISFATLIGIQNTHGDIGPLRFSQPLHRTLSLWRGLNILNSIKK